MTVTEETLRRTNEVPGTRAHLSNLRTSAYKVREVLNLIRGKSVAEARDILRFTERGSAEPVLKLLNSAVANAEHNDQQSGEELFVAACYADEGTTMKRWRPRARGRAGRIRKRGSHITIVVARMDDERLARLAAAEAAQGGGRGRRVASSRADRVAGGKKADASAPVEDTATDAAAEEAVAKNAPEESATTPAAEADTTVADTVEEAEINEAADESAAKEEGK